MAISKWVLLILVVSIAAGLSGSLTGPAYLLTLRERCSAHSLLFSWSCLSWVLLSLDRRDPLSPVTLWGGVKASGAANGRLGPLVLLSQKVAAV